MHLPFCKLNLPPPLSNLTKTSVENTEPENSEQGAMRLSLWSAKGSALQI